MHTIEPHSSVPVVALRLFRLSRELTQTKLGKDCHIPASELGYMEQGRLTPTEQQASRLSEYFGVETALLFKQVDLIEIVRQI